MLHGLDFLPTFSSMEKVGKINKGKAALNLVTCNIADTQIYLSQNFNPKEN